MIRPAKKVIIY